MRHRKPYWHCPRIAYEKNPWLPSEVVLMSQHKAIFDLLTNKNWLKGLALITLFAHKAPAEVITRPFPVSPKISPCENFYQYVCSEEINSFVLPPGRSRYTFFFSDAYENFVKTEKTFVNRLVSQTGGSPYAQQIRSFYKACINEESRLKEERQWVEEFSTSIQKIKTRTELLEFILALQEKGQIDFVALSNAPNTKDVEQWRLQVEVPWNTLSEKSYYANPKVTKDFKDLLRLFFTHLSSSDPSKSARAVFEFETQFAKSLLTATELNKQWDTEKYWTKKEFADQFPLLATLAALPTNIPQWPIHQYTPSVYKMAERLLQTEKLATLKDFLLFKLLSPKMDLVFPTYELARRKFRSLHLGTAAERRDRQTECLIGIEDYLPRPFAYELVQDHFKNFPREKFRQMVEKVRTALVRQIESSSWLSAEGRLALANKIRSADLALLYPDTIADWRFPPLKTLNEDSYLANLATLERSYRERTILELQEARRPEAWSVSPLSYDAFYYRAQNRFYFPAAFTLKPIYDPDRSELENIALIGSVVGHELGHAIDSMGSDYNASGQKQSLLSKQDRRGYEFFSKKLIRQFRRVGHDGELTLAENLADHIGLLSSFEAAFPEQEKSSEDSHRTFFLNFARSWCTSMTDSYRANHLKEDGHALPEARINEQLKRFPPFVRAFQCQKSSTMSLPGEAEGTLWQMTLPKQ